MTPLARIRLWRLYGRLWGAYAVLAIPLAVALGWVGAWLAMLSVVGLVPWALMQWAEASRRIGDIEWTTRTDR